MKWRLLKAATAVGVLLILFALSWSLSLASLRLGIMHGEMRADRTQTHQASLYGRAADLGLVCFLLAQIVIGWMLISSGAHRLLHIHWPWAMAGSVIVGSAACYGLVLMTLSIGGAPDPIMSAAQVLSEWLLNAAIALFG